MDVSYARSIANALEEALELALSEAAVEVHLRVLAPPGFHVTCVTATARTRYIMHTNASVEILDRKLASLRSAATAVRYSPDTATTGFKLLVEGWNVTQYAKLSRVMSTVQDMIVDHVRARVSAHALVHNGITWTVYDQSTRRFVFTSLRNNPHVNAIEFFGGIDAELVVPFDELSDGWRISGHAVLPPLGHPSKSRQRVYVNGVLADGDADAVRSRIESLYQAAYRGAVKQLPSGSSSFRQLATVRKGLNAHPMFILDISTANVDARRDMMDASDARVSHSSLLRMPEVLAAVEHVFLAAWSKMLTGHLLKLLEEHSRQEHGDDCASKDRHIVRIFVKGGFPADAGTQAGDHTDKDAETMVSPAPTLFDDMHATKGIGLDLDRGLDPALHLRKKRRSLAGMQAINAILDGKSAATDSMPLLMPHTTMHSIFAQPVISCSDLQPDQPPVTREDLAGMPRILGQIERKFIAFVTQTNSKVVIIDQHAADERVRLEHLVRLAVLPGNKPNPAHIHTNLLPSPIALHVGEDEETLFRRYRDTSYLWGWRWDWQVKSKYEGGGHRCIVTHVPRLFDERIVSAADLKLYIYQLARLHGANTLVPGAVHRTLASLACRTAIMFGDRISLPDAAKLVSDLSRTRQYYECAHGRPTVACLWTTRQSGPRGGQNASKRSASQRQNSTSLLDLKQKLIFEIRH